MSPSPHIGLLAGAAVVAVSSGAIAQDAAPSTEDLLRLIEAQRALIERQSARIDALEADVGALRGGAPATGPSDTVAAPLPHAEWDTPPADEALTADTISIAPTPAAAASSAASPGDFVIGRFPDDAIVRTGPFDRSVQIPNTNLALRIGGFAEVELIHDFEQATPERALIAALLRDTGDTANRSSFNSRDSRLNFDVRGPTEIGEFRAFIEADFAGTAGNQATTNGDGMRLRHAYGGVGPLYAGQYWSLYSDVQSFPETLNLGLLAGRSLTRQTGVRYNGRLGGGWTYALAVENPNGTISGLEETGLSSVDPVPDVLGNITIAQPWGRISATAVGRHLAVQADQNALASDADAFGWGGNLTGRVRTPVFSDRDNVVFSIAGGSGLGRYIFELAFDGLDAAYDPATGDLDPVDVLSAQVGFQHWWTNTLRSTVTVSTLRIEDLDLLDPNDPRQLTTGGANLLWSPISATTFGAEVAFARREAQSGASVEALRLKLVARYAF